MTAADTSESDAIAFATLAGVTTLDLRTIHVKPGRQWTGVRDVALEPFDLGGQRYAPEPPAPHGTVILTRTTGGLVLELDLEARLAGPCFRCLADSQVKTHIHAREYQANDPDGDDELETPYLANDVLDLSSWARDAIALALPDKILCRDDCAGICPTCGRDLNSEPHEHPEERTDDRWAALADLKDKL
jgi:uncharacterized protein